MAKKTKKHNRGLRFFSILLTLLIILVSFALITYNYTIEKFLSEINFTQIDRESIGISDTAIKTAGVKTVLLLGTDSGDIEAGARSDTIILASVNTNLKTLKLISIPRDTKVDIKGYWPQKINHAYHFGGAELMLHTINSNFDLAVDDYVVIDYAGVAKIVDAVGGIDLELTQEEINFINSRYMAQTARDGKIKSGGIYLDAEPGMVHLNGIQAVTHARDRKSSALADFDRQTRQRNIIEAVIKKLDSKSLPEIMNISSTFLSTVGTSMPKDEILKYLTIFAMNKSEYIDNIKSYQNPSGENGTGYRGIGKIYEFIPVIDKTIEMFNKYINEE